MFWRKMHIQVNSSTTMCKTGLWTYRHTVCEAVLENNQQSFVKSILSGHCIEGGGNQILKKKKLLGEGEHSLKCFSYEDSELILKKNHSFSKRSWKFQDSSEWYKGQSVLYFYRKKPFNDDPGPYITTHLWTLCYLYRSTVAVIISGNFPEHFTSELHIFTLHIFI